MGLDTRWVQGSCNRRSREISPLSNLHLIPSLLQFLSVAASEEVGQHYLLQWEIPETSSLHPLHEPPWVQPRTKQNCMCSSQQPAIVRGGCVIAAPCWL